MFMARSIKILHPDELATKNTRITEVGVEKAPLV